MDSNSYKNVHDENPYKIIWIVIRKKMCMTKNQNIMDSHSYKNVYGKTNKNIDSHPYKDVHDKNP